MAQFYQYSVRNQRLIQSQYVAIYLDAIYFPVRRNNIVKKEAICVALGIIPDSHKEVLDVTIAPQESTIIWEELLLQLKEKGLEEVLLFVTDGLKGLNDVLHQQFPKAKQQRCLVHIMRNIAGKVCKQHRKEILNDFKMIHHCNNKDEAQQCLQHFLMKWESIYPKVVTSLEDNPYLLTFTEFPLSIQKSIYSNNIIESNNKLIKYSLKKKQQFPNVDALERFLVVQYNEYNIRFSNRIHRGFKQCEDTLESMFI